MILAYARLMRGKYAYVILGTPVGGIVAGLFNPAPGLFIRRFSAPLIVIMIRAMGFTITFKRYILRKLILDLTSKAGEMKEKREEILALENQIQKRILDYQSRVRKILTPQQFNLWISRGQMGRPRREGNR